VESPIDGSTYTNTTGIFNNVTAGAYSVTVKNAAGCNSNTSVIVSPALGITTTWKRSV
jgi:hypothetical protein